MWKAANLPRCIAVESTDRQINGYFNYECRREENRRSRRNLFNYKYLWGGNRRIFRRERDLRSSYIDHYDPRLMLITIAVMGLSFLDAVFTLLLLNNGAVEINHLMAYLISMDISSFINTKLMLTGGCMILLVRHENFVVWNRVQVRSIIKGVLLIYISLITYQLVLLNTIS